MFYLISIISLVVLVALHELGHFLIAKFFNVRVDEFGIGIPPRLFAKKIGETIYSLNLLPIGAFVKIFGEDKREIDERSFSEKTIFQRSMIILGGVIAFWVVAFIILTIVMMIGLPTQIDDERISPNAEIVITEIMEESPALEAELMMGDVITGIKFEEENLNIVNKISEVQEFLSNNKNKELIVSIKRGEEEYKKNITPNEEGMIGVALIRTEIAKLPFYKAPFYGLRVTINLTIETITSLFKTLKSIIIRESLPQNVKIIGPVGIVSEITTSALREGIVHYLWIIATISISLAVINLLPIPALDGGRFILLLIEKIKGKPLDEKIEQNLISISFILLLLLFLVITLKDIHRIIF